MSNAALLAWTTVALLGVMTPGIDTLLVLRHTLLGGRRNGFMAVAGISVGCLIWAVAGLVGLTANRMPPWTRAADRSPRCAPVC